MKEKLRRLLAIAASFFLVSILAATPAATPSIERLHANVAWLADPAREGRYAGTSGAADSAKYISDQFKELGFDVQMQEFGGNRRNVIARSGMSANTIVAGAHYDGQGPGFPSASDNAAGVAVLLELARDLKGANLPVSLVLVAFDDEEQGLNGSTYFAAHPPVPLENVLTAVVFDAVGRHFIDLHEWTMIVLGTEYSAELSSVVRKESKDSKDSKDSRKDLLEVGADLIGPRSDFAPFADRRVPFLFFSDGTYVDYHGAGDTADRVDYERLAEETLFIEKVMRGIAVLKARPAYRESPVFPSDEKAVMVKLMRLVESERKDLSSAYRLMLDELEARVSTDPSRAAMRMSMSALLAAATPAHARYFLDVELGPYFESLRKPAIVAALREESARSGQ